MITEAKKKCILEGDPTRPPIFGYGYSFSEQLLYSPRLTRCLQAAPAGYRGIDTVTIRPKGLWSAGKTRLRCPSPP